MTINHRDPQSCGWGVGRGGGEGARRRTHREDTPTPHTSPKKKPRSVHEQPGTKDGSRRCDYKPVPVARAVLD